MKSVTRGACAKSLLSNPNMACIIPALLVHSEEEYTTCLRAIQHHVDRIHIDIADGTLVPNATWAEPDRIGKKMHIAIDLHLMVNDPLSVVTRWKEIDAVDRFIVHAEIPGNVQQVLTDLASFGKHLVLALNPDTLLETVTPSFPLVSGVLFMGVHPGFQGQEFISSVVDKIAAFKAMGTHHTILVDGHVDETTMPKLLAAGATEFCIGSAIFHRDTSPEERLKTLTTQLNRLTTPPSA